MVGFTTRMVSCVVSFASVTLTDVLQARGQETVDGGWPTCSVFVTAKPGTGNEGDTMVVTAGAGNNVVRATVRVKRFRPTGFPKGIEIIGMGTLGYAAEWAPAEDIFFDEVFPDGATGKQIIADALDRVPQLGSGSYSLSNLADSGVIMGLEAPEAFDWKAGTKAWQRIQAIDKAELYRTHQIHDGSIRRERLIGHPNSSANFTLAAADILDGSTGDRNTEQTRNAVVVKGHNYGVEGPVTNGTGTFGSNGEQGDGSDPANRYVEEFSSDLIESGTDPDDDSWDERSGLRADTQAELVIHDVNKEFVEATIRSCRDDTHGPGMTCLLDMLARMAIGEKMFVQRYGWQVSDGWYTEYGLSGGGLDTYAPSYTTPPI